MAAKEKILYLSLRSEFGGATMHVDQLIQYFSSNYEIYCAAPLDEPFGINWKNKLGSRFFELPHRKFRILVLLRLLKFIKTNKIIILHSHGKGAGVYSRIAKLLLRRIFVIHTYHGLHLPIKYFSRKLYLIYEYIFTRFTDELINVSPSEKSNFIKSGILKNKRTKVVYNGIDDIVLDKNKKNNFRLKLNLPLDKIIIINVARLCYQKNIEELLDIATLFLSYKNYQFIVVGDGEEMNKLKTIKEKNKVSNVLLLGEKENVDEYLIASDMFLSTSRWEGLPYSLLEALRASLPIVASNVTGNIDVVQNNINGCLYEPGNISQAKDCITKFANDNGTVKKFEEASRNIFESKFLLQNMLDEIEKIYVSFSKKINISTSNKFSND